MAKKKITDFISVPTLVIFALGLIAAAINIAYVAAPAFADWFNSTVAAALRTAMAYISAPLPFSLAEYCVIASPVLFAGAVTVAVRYAAKAEHGFARAVFAIISAAVMVYVMFTVNFGVGYHTTTLDKRIGLDEHEVTAEDLYDTMNTVVDRINELAPNISYAKGRGSVMPFSHKDCVALCSDSYDRLAEEYGFISSFRAPVKRVILSPYMTYTHISGVYTFFTGEANLNTNFPEYVNVFTTAHEMAHQRGIARENEANFIAYLVCIGSDNEYMQYCGYMNMYEYLSSALYQASPSLYSKAAMRLGFEGRYELKCYTEFFEKYRENAAADVSDTVNDKYLEIQGTEGSRSYGMVVDLAVAYHKSLKSD